MKLENDIETDRLLIRSYKNTDKDFCISIWCSEDTGRYMSDPYYKNIDEKYLSCFDGMEDDIDGYYLIAETKKDNIRVGTFCIFEDNGNYDIGYSIAKDYQRQGYATEMLEAAVKFAKENNGLSITAEVADDNVASNMLLKKFGFVKSKKTRFKKWNEEKYFDAHILKLDLR